MITYKEKDAVLKWLCTSETIDSWEVLEPNNFDFRQLNAILEFLERKGYIVNINVRQNMRYFNIDVRVEAFDLYRHGGFTAIEELLHKNLQKINLELEDLKSQLPEKVGVITSIISAITSTTALFISR